MSFEENKEQVNREEKESKPKKKKSALAFAIEFFVKIAVTAAVIVILVVFIVGIFKHATILTDDAIAYKHNGKICFGRVVARPGDVVDIAEDNLTVNGYGVYENAVYPTTAEGATIDFPYTVPEDTVFVLNDYRPDPEDSRKYGGISLKDTKGKIILMIRRRGF